MQFLRCLKCIFKILINKFMMTNLIVANIISFLTNLFYNYY